MDIPNQGQGQAPMGGGGSNLARYEQSKQPAPDQNQNFMTHARDRLKQYQGGGKDRIDAALAQAQGGQGGGGGQTINSGQTGTPGMGSQAQQPQGPQVGYQNLQMSPSQEQQRTIDTINAMDYHKMDPGTQQYYAQQLGYDPQQMQQMFPAPGAQVQLGMQAPMGAQY